MGEVFAGRYELVDLIGQGGMGTIWRAWDARTEQMVAAKVLRQSDAATLLRFVREQSVRIHHPHVVVPLGWAGEDDRVLFTMPIVRGGSVADLVKDFGALPPLLVAELLRQLLEGLRAVHAAGLVHRDVKPANLLLDPTGTGRPHLYLTDFGISIDLRAPRWTETGVVSGTPGYLAPEAERFGEVTPAIDLYAAGQVALTMLLGAKPRQRSAVLDRPAGVPEALWVAIGALVAPDPADRPADAGAALAGLRGAELAWTEGAIGEVEVFEHIAAGEPSSASGGVTPLEPDLDPDGGTTRPRVRAGATPPLPAAATPPHLPTVTPREIDPPTPTPTPAPTHPATPAATASSGSSWTSWLVPAGLATVGLTGVLLIWSPWQGGSPDDTRTSSTTSTTSTTSSTTSATGPATTSTTPSTPTSSTPAPPPSTTGSVGFGTVVTSVGQSCEATEVGLREETVGGTPVVCTRRSNGTYAWLEQ